MSTSIESIQTANAARIASKAAASYRTGYGQLARAVRLAMGTRSGTTWDGIKNDGDTLVLALEWFLSVAANDYADAKDTRVIERDSWTSFCLSVRDSLKNSVIGDSIAVRPSVYDAASAKTPKPPKTGNILFTVRAERAVADSETESRYFVVTVDKKASKADALDTVSKTAAAPIQSDRESEPTPIDAVKTGDGIASINADVLLTEATNRAMGKASRDGWTRLYRAQDENARLRSMIGEKDDEIDRLRAIIAAQSVKPVPVKKSRKASAKVEAKKMLDAGMITDAEYNAV